MLASSSLSDPPTRQNLAIGQHDRIHLDSPLRHLGPCFQTGVAAPRSMISVVVMAGLPPPMMITRGS